MLIEQQIALEWLRRWRGETWADMEIVQQVVAQFPWRSNIMLLKSCWNLDRVFLVVNRRAEIFCGEICGAPLLGANCRADIFCGEIYSAGCCQSSPSSMSLEIKAAKSVKSSNPLSMNSSMTGSSN